MSKNNEIQRKSEHKIDFSTNDKNALTTFLHSTDDVVTSNVIINNIADIFSAIFNGK